MKSHTMPELLPLVGCCSIFAVIGIVSHVLHQMPFKPRTRSRAERRRETREGKRQHWLFRSSGKRWGQFLGWFSGAALTLLLSASGAGVGGHYPLAKWLFVGAASSTLATAWFALAVLAGPARVVWTSISIPPIALLFVYFYYLACPSVIVSPPSIPFSKGWKFTIRNKTDDDLYSVSFRLRVESSKLRPEDFKIEVPPSSIKPLDPGHDESPDMRWKDCMDSYSRPVFIAVINHLGPTGSSEDFREIIIRRNLPDNIKSETIVPVTVASAVTGWFPAGGSVAKFWDIPLITLDEGLWCHAEGLRPVSP